MSFQSQKRINIFKSIFFPDEEIDLLRMIIQQETKQNSIQKLGIYSKTVEKDNLGIENKTKIINNENDSSSFYELGRILFNGSEIESDPIEAFKYFKKSSDLGNSNAMVFCGFILHQGKAIDLGQKIPVDYEGAIKYYKMAIELGNSNAMNNYAIMLKQGQGIPIDYEEAIKYYKMAIELGNSDAMYNYANMKMRLKKAILMQNKK